MTAPVPHVTLPCGETVAALGQGTWYMGEQARKRASEVAALRRGIELGLTLIDTAEMYADGGAEEVVGEAVAGQRDRVFIVSKVLPSNASRKGTITACERSLRRMGIDIIDLYLLHWRGSYPLGQTLEAFHALQRDGKIRHWGVSNFDLADMHELAGLPGGDGAAVNQVLYNLARRGIEHDLLPWSQGQRIPVMAYSPIEQSRLLRNGTLQRVAQGHGATPAQVALAWVLRQTGVIAIPKAGTVEHVEENRKAAGLHLTRDDLAALDRAFPPPDGPAPLEML
jgi:diketogulonate reductase-like aldo/keto reductase